MADTEDLSGSGSKYNWDDPRSIWIFSLTSSTLRGIQPMFDDPNLPKGWSREVVQRKVGGRYEVSLMTPDGKQLKTRAELGQYIKDNKIKMRPDEFDFTVMGKNYVPTRSGRSRTAAKTPQPEAKPSKKDTAKKDDKMKSKKPTKTPMKEKVAATPTRRSTRGGAKDTEDDEEQEEETVKKKTKSTKKKKEDSEKEEEPSEDDTKEDVKEKILPKRGRVKPKRYDSPEPEPAPRRAKMKALFKDIEDEEAEPETPSRGRGRPKKVDVKEEPEEKSPTKGKKTTAKKAKPKKRAVDPDDPDAAKNSQILAEIEAELAEINGTTGRRRGPRKRRGSSTTTVAKTPQETKPVIDNNNKDRPALEGFEVEDKAETKRQRSESKSSDVPPNDVKTEIKMEEEGQSQAGTTSTSHEIPPELADGRRRSARAKKIDIPALLRPDPESPDEEEEIFAKPKKQKKLTSPKPIVKSKKKKVPTATLR